MGNLTPAAAQSTSPEMTLEESAGVRRLAGGDLLGRAGDDDLAAGVATYGAEVDHMVCEETLPATGRKIAVFSVYTRVRSS